MEIKKEFLLSLYDNSTLEVRETLELEYGKELFKKSITDIVKEEYDAKLIYDKRHPKLGDKMFYKLSEKHNNYVDAFISALVIAEALNEGWEPDWRNMRESKWSVGYDNMKKSFVSVFNNANNWGQICFKSKELAEYFIKQFPDICKIIYCNNKH